MRPRCHCGIPACWIDRTLHAVGIHWRWICDRHDARILGES